MLKVNVSSSKGTLEIYVHVLENFYVIHWDIGKFTYSTGKVTK